MVFSASAFNPFSNSDNSSLFKISFNILEATSSCKICAYDFRKERKSSSFAFALCSVNIIIEESDSFFALHRRVCARKYRFSVGSTVFGIISSVKANRYVVAGCGQ